LGGILFAGVGLFVELVLVAPLRLKAVEVWFCLAVSLCIYLPSVGLTAVETQASLEGLATRWIFVTCRALS